MKRILKISCFAALLIISYTTNAQTETGLIPYSNKLLINPSYAGINKDTHFSSTLQFNSQPGKKLNNLWAVTYDTWWEKTNGGFSIQFYQGLYGAGNINTTGAGFAFSRPYEILEKWQIIPSAGFGSHIASKQWFTRFMDNLMSNKRRGHDLSEQQLMKYSIYRPAAGLLLNSEIAEIGLSGYYSFYFNHADEEPAFEKTPFVLMLHAAKKKKGLKKGLISQPVKMHPEITVIYSEAAILSGAGIRITDINYEMGFFLQSNYTENNHGIICLLGKSFNNIRLNFSAGGNFSVLQRKAGFFGGASLGFTIPYIHIDKLNPWTPVQNDF